MNQPRHRLAVDSPLAANSELVLEGNPAHYLMHVLRLKPGDTVSVFNRTDGEWCCRIIDIRKKALLLQVDQCMRAPAPMLPFTVCFAPIKGGRLETIIEKATELGAAVLQPVITRRTIVDKVNLERANSIAREAAEQCERIDWPEIREPVKLEKLLGDWPSDTTLYYGDESGGGVAITELFCNPCVAGGEPRAAGVSAKREGGASPPSSNKNWGILAGPEGGFVPEELALLRKVSVAKGVSLGPRILRADTAVITLSALTLAAFGDWHRKPRFTGE